MRKKVEQILAFIVLAPIIGYAAWQFVVMFLYGLFTGQLL